jgi:PAS domain S-box-containing protein
VNSSSFDQILRQVLIVPILVILLGAGAIFWQMRQANHTVADIERSDQIIAGTLLIERLVVDQESALRGYQTTGDQVFLEPYYAADKQLPAEFDRRRDAARTAEGRTAISDLQTIHDSWKEGFADPLIDSIRAGAQTNDVDLNLLGKRQMDDMRTRLTALIDASQQRRNTFIAHWRQQVRMMTDALVVLAIVIGLVIGLYTRRQLQDVSNAFRQSLNIVRIRAEQTFRSEQKLRTTLQSIGDGVITCDAQGHIDSMNEVAQQLTGWTNEEAHGLPLEQVFNIVSQTTREPVEHPVETVKRLNRVISFANHTILIRRDGTEIYIDDSGAPIRDKHGKLMGVVLVFRDITMAVKSEQALLANEKLAVAGRLAATIAHEIHNPLDSVSNLLFLMDGQSTPDESQEFLRLAKSEIARVTQISRAMLSLYRESKAPVEIDLSEMLRSILLLMERRFSSLGVSVEVDLPGELIVHGFPAELRQVFTNLLTNAGEASLPDDVIRVAARYCPAHVDVDGIRHEAGACVSISDHGPGVPEEIQAQLFQPFFTTKGERGTGLGLWVSRGIITKHGGKIELTSNSDPIHHGTTVSVFLATDPVINAGGD